MKETTLCYIERDGAYLMLHRVKKAGDINRDKWIGVGGKLEKGETPTACAIRETLEETGLLIVPIYRGIVDFRSNIYEPERMHLFTATEYEGELIPCDEGTLEWVDKRKIKDLPIWEGDMVFFELLERGEGFFHIELVYSGERLAEVILL